VPWRERRAGDRERPRLTGSVSGTRELNVLVVDDRPADAEMAVAELERAGLRPSWTRVATRDEFLDGLTADLDLILSDYKLPRFDAPTALALLRESGLAIPLIVVAGTTDEEVAVECMKLGASDYLLKDRLARLGPAALQALELQSLALATHRIETELEERERRFRRLVEQLPAAVYMWEAGTGGDCYYVSPAIESILGYAAEDWLADSQLWTNCIHPEDRDRVVARELHSRTTGDDLRTEYRMFARDGAMVWIRDEAIMVRSEDGGLDHLQGVMYDVSLEKKVEASLRRSREETIRRLSRAAEYRDDETGAHIERVSRYCELIAISLGLDPERCEQLRIASPMHDVGKIGIPDAILLKPGPLNAEERAEIERHAEIGHCILNGSDAALLDLAATIAWTHHERWDGHGYPRGLEQEEIPLAGRIAAVADVFDALTSHRIYRPAMSYPEAVAIMRSGRGSQFDPRVLDVFLEAESEIRATMSPAPKAE
jgi:PAS domain S-box-containing protein